jgi:manganese oxidase
MFAGMNLCRCFFAMMLIAIAAPRTFGCPWCKKSPVQNPTVTLEMGDPGGKFFGKTPPREKSRNYFIAAEPVQWRFMPKGGDPVAHSPVPERFLTNQAMKLRYVQYTDEKFNVLANHPEHLGILGPVLRAKTGEFIVIKFLNRTERPLSMHPHGVKYDKDSEGASYFPERGMGAAVAPGASFTYVWHADAAAGPSAHEPSTKAWLYHSHVLADEEINLGLLGFILVTDPERARPDGTPIDVDRELATAFIIFDESPREDEDWFSVPLPPDPVQWSNFLHHRFLETVSEIQKTELGARHSVNGRIFGNLSGLEMIEGERVRWYLFALGSEQDLHTAHWHGARVTFNGRMTDVVELLPGSMEVTDVTADNPGNWLFHCHVADHMMEGMYAPFIVYPRSSTNAANLSGASLYSPTEPAESLRIGSLTFKEINGTRAAQVTARFHLRSLPKVTDLPLHLKIGGQTWSFCLDERGKDSSEDGASVHMAMAGSGGGVVEMKLTLDIPESKLRDHLNQGLAVALRHIPVELHLGQTYLSGTLFWRRSQDLRTDAGTFIPGKRRSP